MKADSDEKTYPWVVPILTKRNREFMCAGTLLTEYHVITSGACLRYEKTEKVVVCIGSKDRSTCAHEGIKYDLEQIITRSGYETSSFVDNLSIAVTKEKIKFSESVGPACFSEEISNAGLAETDLIFLGWGDFTEIRKLDFVVKQRSKCTPFFETFQSDIHICAAPKTISNNKDDMGGSYVMLNTITGRYTLVGILSHIPSFTFARPVPSLLTNVTSYREWIKRKVKEKRHAELCRKI